MVKKEEKTFMFTIASGWTGYITTYSMMWALTKLRARGHDVKKIEEING